MKGWRDSVTWSQWQCATCGLDQEDPDAVKETTCGNGHTNYLGPVSESQHRRAYKSAKERASDIRQHNAMVEMFSAAFSSGRKKIIASGRKPNL